MKNQKYKDYFKFLIAILSFSFFILSFSAAYAAIVPCDGPDCTICHLFIGVKNLVDFLTMSIAMPVAVVVLLYGGFMYATSGGSESRRSKGHNALQYAIFGLVIVFAAWLIIDTILRVLADPGQLPKFWTAFKPC